MYVWVCNRVRKAIKVRDREREREEACCVQITSVLDIMIMKLQTLRCAKAKLALLARENRPWPIIRDTLKTNQLVAVIFGLVVIFEVHFFFLSLIHI